MNDFYSKLRQRLYSDAKVVNYYAKEKDLGRNHDNYGACTALAGVLKELGHPTSVAVYENDEGYITKLVGRNAALYQTVMRIVKGGGVDGN